MVRYPCLTTNGLSTLVSAASLHGYTGLTSRDHASTIALIEVTATVGCTNGGRLLCRVDAGKVELDGAQYLGFNLPFTISQLLWIEVLLVGGAEVYRNSSTNLEERIYPGPSFLPYTLNLNLIESHAPMPPWGFGTCVHARVASLLDQAR